MKTIIRLETSTTPTTKTNHYSPSFSDDGSLVVFTSFRDGNTEIYVMDADGSNQTRLTNNTVSDDSPTLSPDGFTVAYTSNRSGNWEIILWVGVFETNLTNNAADDSSPAFSPDGKKIAFTSSRGDYEIYTMKAKPERRTNRPKNLTANSVTDYLPDWQPRVN